MEDDLVSSGEAYLKIDRELRRCSNDSIEALEQVQRSTVMFKFPVIMPKKCTTTLVLKAPKTESSNRTVYLPMAVVHELQRVQKRQEEYKLLLGDEYRDYGLVIAQLNGRPYEQRVIDKMLLWTRKRKSHCRNRAHTPWNRLRPCSTLAAQPHISSSSRRSSGSSA